MKRAVIVAAAVCLIIGSQLRAQSTYEAVHTFSGNRGRPVAGLTGGADGRLYGTTESGGQYGKGSVFSVDPGGLDPQVLYEFSGADGAAPLGRLLHASDGNFYGTTSTGGSGGWGTVFRITPDGVLTTLVAFDDVFGAAPQAGLLEVGGILYGTTLNGGTGLSGTVFAVALDGSGFNAIPFEGPNGAAPRSALIYRAADDSIYGTAEVGGANNEGTVFQLAPDRTTLTAVASFDPALNGRRPRAGLVEASDGNLYGTTPADEFGSFGTVFRLTAANDLSTVVTFTEDNGANPAGGLSAFNGAVYGTTQQGGVGFGTVFRLALADDSLETLWSFGLSDGAFPRGELIQTTDGSLFGTTSTGGSGGLGTVFQLTPDNALTTTLSFAGSGGSLPSGRLLQATDGNVYGMTIGGGSSGLGSIFRLTPDGFMTTLVSFDGGNGDTPSGGLVQASDGHLYGTTEVGGFGDGTVFRFDLVTGELTTLAEFDSFGATGAVPRGGLIEANGSLWGTTEFGPDFTSGSVFGMTLDGTLTTVAVFDGDDGGFPTSGVVQGLDGHLYGVTEEGGEFFGGTLFRISMPDNSFTTIKAFDGFAEGFLPTARPLVASDGSLYGTTTFGGDADQGVVYRVASDGSFSVVASFDGVNGSMPTQEGLVAGHDGNLYGTANGGGDGFGTVYRLDEGGIVPIHLFDGVTGARPNSTLITSFDGALYGTTEGPLGGTVYRITFEDEAQASLVVAPASATFGGVTTLSATLSSSSGPIANQEIAFSLNGVAVGAAVTDASGVAMLDGVSVAGLDAGSYPGAVHASAASVGAEAIGDLTIAQAVPTVSVVGGIFTYDAEPHAATATVTGVAGEDLGAAVITYNGSPGAPIEPDTYAVLATYAGSLNYEASSGTAVLTILPPAPGVAGLIAAYGFNEGGGDVAADSSGRGHHGVIAGAKYVDGRFGRALRFDGQYDWVTVADAADLDLRNALTIEAWVNPSALSGWRTVVIKERNNSSQAYALYASEDMPGPSGYVNIGGTYKGVSGPSQLPLNAWTHVAVTYNGSMLRLYINGVEVNRRPVSGRMVVGNAPLRIGGNSIWGEYFDGMIDEVRIYGSAISPADIQRDMNMPIARETEPPSVSIVSPLDGGVLSGRPVISVAASDNVAVASVEIQVDGMAMPQSLAEAPYTTRLDAANGTHTIRAIARDTAGNMAMSDPITVRIANRRVADYRFNEGSGRAVVDGSGLGNHGTMSLAGVTRAVDAQRGQILQFSGFGGMVSVPDADSLDLTTAITLEAWVKPSAISGWRTVVLKEGNDSEQYSIYANEDVSAPAGYVLVDSDYRAVHGNRRLTLGVWTHLAMTYDGTTMRMFVNGEEKDSRPLTGAAMISDGQLSIGGNTIWGEWFRGQMDDVRIYDAAVGEAQIKADMNGVEPE
jgi:uncharacterized repeat protein (TIGR03803 family)